MKRCRRLSRIDPNQSESGPLHLCFLDKLIRGRLLKKILGARDLNVNITNQFGNTPLILALYDGDIEGAEMLLHMQAEPNLPNLEGKPPI